MEIAISTPDYIGRVEKHLLGEFALAVEQWSSCIAILTKWEDENLLDTPTAENLAAHRKTVERLIRFGKFIFLVTSQQEFSDRKTAEMVEATQQILADKLRMFHNPITETEAEKILGEVFPE